ncbi:MAG: hypothetical protein ABMA25_19395 [Ilumatobacteraceae bacterium]
MRRSLLTLVATGLLLAACGGSESTGTGAAPTAAPEATSAVETAPGDSAAAAPDTAPGDSAPAAAAPVALQFSAPAVGGGEIDFTRYAGRAVVLWFWAPT